MKQTKNIAYWERTLNNPPESYKKLFEEEKNYIQKNIIRGQKVLDVGCGHGRTILNIATLTDDITGIDIDPKAVQATKRNLSSYPNIKVVLGSATELPFEDKAFDIVIFSMTLVNLDNEKDKAISEMKRVIKDGGKIIISIYSEKAQSEREKMYKQIQLPITKITNGKFIFGTGDNMVSEQFSIQDIKNIIEPLGLKIDCYEEVENLAYIFTLKTKDIS